MARRARIDDVVDPTRARLAELASAPPHQEGEPTDSPPPRKSGGASRSGRRRGRGKPGAARRNKGNMTVNRKVMVTEDEAERFAEATRVISASFGGPVTYSQITRALWALACGIQDTIRTRTPRIPSVSIPSRGDRAAMAEYEQALADFLEIAIKRT